MLNKQFLFHLVEYIRTKEIPRISVKSNGVLMNKEILDSFRSHDVIWETTLFSIDEKVHDTITGYSGSLKTLIENIHIALEYDIEIKIVIELLGLNYSTVSKTVDYLRSLRAKNIVIEPVLLDMKKIWPDQLKKFFYKTKEQLQGVSQNIFFRNQEGHTCWNGSLAVTVSGDILPCPMARQYTIGNTRKIRLKDVMRGEYICKLWGLNKDKIEKCCDCEFRFACFDCRVRESFDGSLCGKPKFCLI